VHCHLVFGQCVLSRGCILAQIALVVLNFVMNRLPVFDQVLLASSLVVTQLTDVVLDLLMDCPLVSQEVRVLGSGIVTLVALELLWLLTVGAIGVWNG